tara:strand:- start:390 stop:566 length:177 start_codon:yes stop_codon:yes gene_type:complete
MAPLGASRFEQLQKNTGKVNKIKIDHKLFLDTFINITFESKVRIYETTIFLVDNSVVL